MQRCLPEVLRRTDYKAKFTVVDNGSTDGLVEWLRDQPIELIENEENIGIAGACNLAWERYEKQYNYVVKLDSDVLITRSDWLTDMIVMADQQDMVGLIGHIPEEDIKDSVRPGELAGRKVWFTCSMNVAGATVLVPRRVWELCGFWPDILRPYTMEDGIYSFVARSAGFMNIYLDGGETPYIELLSKDEAPEYGAWKLRLHKRNQMFMRTIWDQIFVGRGPSIV